MGDYMVPHHELLALTAQRTPELMEGVYQWLFHYNLTSFHILFFKEKLAVLAEMWRLTPVLDMC